ncbi:hypothetical protein PV797_08025 [Clostridiaceae bacterium M8S5]|nr:hypothetical protein PV797_08025 [Clostridiaceae bacterium M8S5]
MKNIGNYKDFDLDLKKVSGNGAEIQSILTTNGPACLVSAVTIVYSCICISKTCSENCPPPNESQDQCLP